jgi:hypothetical protein
VGLLGSAQDLPCDSPAAAMAGAAFPPARSPNRPAGRRGRDEPGPAARVLFALPALTTRSTYAETAPRFCFRNRTAVTVRRRPLLCGRCNSAIRWRWMSLVQSSSCDVRMTEHDSYASIPPGGAATL